jgi:BirA family biotin operon repressor/biotin-[acetyl-CoA-carboxylase] ligase
MLLDHWKSLTDIIGRKVSISRIGGNIAGTIKDIDSDGALLLQTNNGNTEKILSGDITLK